jgi:chromosome partitioning protein
MTHIIAVASAKGGTGKTTTALNLGAAIAERGARVLLIDNDPERHLSNSLGIGAAKYTVASLMSSILNDMDTDELLSKCIVRAGALDCIPSGAALAGMASQLTVRQNSARLFAEPSGIGSEYVLKAITDKLGGKYAYIIIDCGRSLDMLTINALTAAKEVVIPVQAHFLPEEGLASFLETVSKVRESLNPELEVGGILITMYQGATKLCRTVAEDISKRFGKCYRVFRQPIPHSIKVAEAPAFGRNIFEHDALNPAALGYISMASEVMGDEKELAV